LESSSPQAPEGALKPSRPGSIESAVAKHRLQIDDPNRLAPRRDFTTGVFAKEDLSTRSPSVASRFTKASPMKSLSLLLIATLGALLPLLTASAQTEFQGNVSGVWNRDGSPYIQVGAATVPQGQSLTILPGVEILLGQNMMLRVDGSLTASGTVEDTIRFRNPEGVQSGRLYIPNGDEEAQRLSYCRFDSLEYAFWVLEHHLLVEHCLFFGNRNLRLEGGSMTFRNNSLFNNRTIMFRDGDEALESVEISDVTFYNSDMVVQSASAVTVERNIALNHRIRLPERPQYSWLCLRDCNGVQVSENSAIEIVLDGSVGEGAIVENNRLTKLGVTGNQRWGTVVRDNVLDELSVSFAFAEARNNDIGIVQVKGMNFIGRAVLERNLIRNGLEVGDTCFVELTNNTIVVPRGYATEAIRVIAGGDDYQSTVTLRNNLLISLAESPFAARAQVDNIRGGWNYYWGFQEVFEGREGLLPNDQVGEPMLRGGFPFDVRLRADSPCIDAGDPDSPPDPDGTRADIGCFYFDQ